MLQGEIKRNNFLTSALLVLLIVISPLIFVSSHTFGFEVPKTVFITLINFLFFAVLFVSARKSKSIIELDIFDYLALFLIFIFLISSFMAGTLIESVVGASFQQHGILFYLSCVLLFVGLRRVADKRTVRLIYKLFVVGALIQTVVLILQFVQLNFLNLPITEYSGRVIGTFGQPNYAAGYVLIGFAISVAKTLDKRKFLYLFLSIVFLVGIAVTESVGAIVAAGVAVLFIFLARKNKEIAFVGFLGIVCLVFALGFLWIGRDHGDIEPVGLMQIESRENIYRGAFELIIQRPLIGYGVDNLYLFFPGVHGGEYVNSAHNALLDYLLMGGVFAGVIYISFVITAVSRGTREELLPAGGAFVAIIIRDLVNTNSSVNIVIFWILLAVLVGVEIESRDHKSSLR